MPIEATDDKVELISPENPNTKVSVLLYGATRRHPAGVPRVRQEQRARVRPAAAARLRPKLHLGVAGPDQRKPANRAVRSRPGTGQQGGVFQVGQRRQRLHAAADDRAQARRAHHYDRGDQLGLQALEVQLAVPHVPGRQRHRRHVGQQPAGRDVLRPAAGRDVRGKGAGHRLQRRARQNLPERLVREAAAGDRAGQGGPQRGEKKPARRGGVEPMDQEGGRHGGLRAKGRLPQDGVHRARSRARLHHAGAGRVVDRVADHPKGRRD
ncbi:hypothetical protein KL941_003119 [Ogataea angusta]|nr:hypothetical protein KL941_003119 [Ogataea angusta]